MLMNGAIRALLQAMHPYAKDAVRFRYDGQQIERKKKERDGRRKEKEDKSRGGKGRRDGFDSLARSVIRATEFVSRDQGLEESTV